MIRVARVAAQAKINLCIRILGRDASGYHPLFTVFQRIDLADDVVVRVGTGERTVRMSGPELPPVGLGDPETNLAYRAARAYAAHSQTPFADDFTIEVTKRIPVGGGLGGGSADAGAVLRALDALAPAPMGATRLTRIARSLGADVPFLASGFVRAMGLDYGDLISQLDLPSGEHEPEHVVLAVPAFAIATADAYRWLDEDRGQGWGTASQTIPVPGLGAGTSWSAAWCREGNDFEAVAEKRFPTLRTLREQLVAAGAVAARLAGSGACVFGLFQAPPPPDDELALDARVIRTRASARVVQVEVGQ